MLDYNYFNRLLDCFLTGKVTDSWLIYKEIRDRGFDSHFFIAGLADYLRDLMVALDPSTIVLLETDDEARAAMAATAKKCTPDFLLSAMKLCNEADLNYREASNKQFLIELTLAKLCQLSSPSPLNAGDGEGQLKPIARPTASAAPAATPSAAQPTAPQAAPQPAPQAQPAPTPTAAPANVPPPAPRRMAPTPQRQGHAQGRAPLTFSISGRNQAAATADGATSAATAPRTVRSEIYTDEDLRHAWQDFMNARPTERILVNTMRASFPDRIDGHSYRIKVENEKQEELLNQHMPELIGELRNALSNDNITLKIEINQGEASPHTWNDREVVAYVQQTVPALNDFIETFKLTL